MKTNILVILGMLTAALTFSLEPPRPGEMARLKAKGQLAERQAFAKKLGNWQLKWTKPGLREAGFRGLPPQGTSRIFLLLVDFPDYSHGIPASAITSAIFGAGNKDYYPYESLRAYYQRSSYGLLDIQGAILGWYRAQNARDYYTDHAEVLIEEAITHFDGLGHDFAQYDNNGDGTIEYFAVYWTGPDEGWSSFWWGWNSSGFGDPEFTVDGKHLGNFTWQWEEPYASTIIHETGHALGLPDYYDYDDSIGPRGGVGGLDIMDGWGDHNGFSKWVLGWLTPTVVTSPAAGLQLSASSSAPAAVVIRAGFMGDSPYDEYYLIQNRQRIGNDKGMPGDGLLIFHVDARRACGGFLYDNSYTIHKLLRVMEADGNEDIEKGRWGDEGDFYRVADDPSLTPLTFPHSDLYAGRSSGVWVENLDSAGRVLYADLDVRTPSSLVAPPILYPEDGSRGVPMGASVQWTAVPDAAGYSIELWEGLNPLERADLPASALSWRLPENQMTAGSAYRVEVKARGDGISTGTGDFSRTQFVLGCADEAFWISRTFDQPPCPVWAAAFAFDPGTGSGILYGGSAGTETFEYDGSGWASYASAPSPPYRWYTTMAYDPVSRGMLLFGGWNFDTSEAYGDTWLYTPSTHTWKKMEVSGGPWADWAARMTTDPVRNVIVLYQPGGTWEWNGSAWLEMPDAETPSIYYTDIAFDKASGAILLFGGWGDQGPMEETWIYRQGRWERLFPQTAPPARSWGELFTDPVTGQAMLFGGDDGSNAFGDVWEWEGGSWSPREVCSPPPAGLWGPMGDMDPRRMTFVVFSSGNPVFELGGLGGFTLHGRPVAPPE